MTTLKDILLELRAIRTGLQLYLKRAFGVEFDLLRVAENDETHKRILDRMDEIRKPRSPDTIIHRNSDHLLRQQRLKEAGDDTLKMIETIREQFGGEKAQQLVEFYEKEILGKQ